MLAQKRPKLVPNMHFWSIWAIYWHFLLILSHAGPKTNVNKVPRWVFGYVGNKFHGVLDCPNQLISTKMHYDALLML